MAYTTINKSSDYFNTKLYTGNGGTQSITGVGHQPDFTWIKQRDNGAYSHMAFDAVRGVGKSIIPDTNAAEGNQTNGITAFGTDGFSIGDFSAGNYNGRNYVAWNWKAGGGQGSSNTDGSINTTYTSANTTAGFSISKYVGTGSTATVGHGLGAVPKMLIIKDLSASTDWTIYHVGVNQATPSNSAQSRMVLNTTASSEGDGSFFNNTTPTSSVFTIGSSSAVNLSGRNYVCYAFTDIVGYSKFGSYMGNGNPDGTFIYLGFKPAFVMFKRSDGGTENWALLDSTRSYANVSNHTLAANSSNAESSFGGGESVFGASNKVDILSNGIKIREASAYNNTSGAAYIYMAFAEAPLVGTNGVTAKAR
jgi:hypothetical protein